MTTENKQPAGVRVCAISDIECSRGCGAGACQKEATSKAVDTSPDRNGLIEQHHRDSAELRRVCADRDEARRTAEYWKAEHNAANKRIAELELDRNSWRALAESAKRDLHARATTQQANKGDEPQELFNCPQCHSALHYTECSDCGFDTTRATNPKAVAGNACPFCDAVHDGNSCMEAYREREARATTQQANKGDELRIAQLEDAVERYCKLVDVWKARATTQQANKGDEKPFAYAPLPEYRQAIDGTHQGSCMTVCMDQGGAFQTPLYLHAAAPQAVTLSDDQRAQIEQAICSLEHAGFKHEPADLLALLAAHPTVQRMSDAERWIPLSEKHPEEGTHVICHAGFTPYVAYLSYDDENSRDIWIQDGEKVETPTHWIPMPVIDHAARKGDSK